MIYSPNTEGEYKIIYFLCVLYLQNTMHNFLLVILISVSLQIFYIDFIWRRGHWNWRHNQSNSNIKAMKKGAFYRSEFGVVLTVEYYCTYTSTNLGQRASSHLDSGPQNRWNALCSFIKAARSLHLRIGGQKMISQ